MYGNSSIYLSNNISRKYAIPVKKKIIFELKPSSIHGVGVFASQSIKKGEQLPLFEYDDHRFIPKSRIKTSGIALKHFYKHALWYPEGYSAPKNFNRMSIGWYLNHSDTPNAYHDDKHIYYAKRAIRSGEEITIDYNLL